jgi:hypothetical protein
MLFFRLLFWTAFIVCLGVTLFAALPPASRQSYLAAGTETLLIFLFGGLTLCFLGLLTTSYLL